jgi:type I restriction enzyme S subunit
MKKYQSYNKIDDILIKEVPKEWEISRLKWISDIENSGVWGEDNEFENSILVPIPTTGQLSTEGIWNYDKMNLRYLTKNEWEKYKCIEGDIVVVKSSGSSTNIITGKCGFINSSDNEKFGFSNFLLRVRSKKMISKLLYYFLSSNITKQRIEKMVSSTTYPNLKVEEYSNSLIIYPPLQEQQQIVNYLDEKTTIIDKLISTKQRKIELLKEQRTTLINQVITKGLNPNVKMKDSGVEWIGGFPNNWVKSKIRNITQEHRQGYYSSESYTDIGLRVVRITDLNDDRTISVEYSPYYQLNEIEKDRFILKDGDFLFPRTGGVGRFGIFNNSTPSIYGSFLIRFRFLDDVLNQFMRYYFDSGFYLNQILSEIHGGVNQNIHVENIKDCIIFYPNKLEQEKIVSYLDKHTKEIDDLMNMEQKKIELLKEYRQSLISEVITGKIKVID